LFGRVFFRRTGAHFAGRTFRAAPAIGLAISLVAALALAGCTTSGQRPAAFARGGAATVAFESVDGPPPEVFQKYVQNLTAEAKARQIAVVSREGPAQFRVRGYLAAAVRRGRTSFAWVWDVYDTDARRAVRIAGEEAAGRAGRDAWAAADDAMLRRIAQAGMERLAVFLNGGGEAPPRDSEPASAGPAVAGPAPATVLANR
jgi:hypothetical protein